MQLAILNIIININVPVMDNCTVEVAVQLYCRSRSSLLNCKNEDQAFAPEKEPAAQASSRFYRLGVSQVQKPKTRDERPQQHCASYRKPPTSIFSIPTTPSKFVTEHIASE